MSAKAIAWAFEREGLKLQTRMVLFVLADSADKLGECWPSLATITRCSGMSKRSVCYALDDLAQQGLLEREPRHADSGRQTSTLYRLHRDARVIQSEGDCARGAQGTVHVVHREGASHAQGTVHAGAPLNMLEPPEGRKETPEADLVEDHPPQTPATKKHRGSATTTPPVVLPASVDAAVWAAFVADRLERKKPMTKRAQELALARLERMHAEGHNVRAVIEQSIERGWQTFYPVKGAEPQQQPQESFFARSVA